MSAVKIKAISVIIVTAVTLTSSSISVANTEQKPDKAKTQQTPDKDAPQKARDPAKIIDELITTEREYNKGLNALQNNFLTPLSKIKKLKKNAPVQAILKLMSMHISAIKNLSDSVLADLAKKNTSTGVANILIKFAPYFKMYGPYLSDYPEMNEKKNRNEFKNNKEVTKMEGKLSDQYKNLQSDDILITPMQRIPRYRMLLEELQKAVPGNARVKEALDSIETTANYVNDYGRVGKRPNKK